MRPLLKHEIHSDKCAEKEVRPHPHAANFKYLFCFIGTSELITCLRKKTLVQKTSMSQYISNETLIVQFEAVWKKPYAEN